MKRRRFSEEQITYALRLAGSETPVVDICREIGIAANLTLDKPVKDALSDGGVEAP